jgi:ATP-dependent RNA helicase SUPV3L1/SUV3
VSHLLPLQGYFLSCTRSIKRVIFETVQKNNGNRIVTLSNPEIRQIAGRAGRYRTANQDTDVATLTTAESNQSLFPADPEPQPLVSEKPNVGWVTTLEKVDLPIVKKAMSDTVDSLNTAGVMPPPALIQRFSSYFPPGTPFSYILIRLNEISQLHSRFHVCNLRDQVAIADAIHSIQNLTIEDRMILSNAPASMKHKPNANLIRDCALCVSEQRGGNILDIPSLNLDILDREIVGERSYLRELEILHKGVILYLWLSFRFPGVFTTRPLATHIKELIEGNIEQTLKLLSFSETKRRRAREKLREAAVLADFRHAALMNDSATIQDGHQRALVERGETSELDSEAAEVVDTLGDERNDNESRTWDDEGEYPEEDLEGEDESELQATANRDRVFEDVSNDTTPLGTGEDEEDLDIADDMDSESGESVDEVSSPNELSTMGLSAPTSISEESTEEFDTENGDSVGRRRDAVQQVLAENSQAEAEKTPGPEEAQVDEAETSRTDTLQRMKPSIPIPFQSIQPSSSDELAKLIAAQQQQ